jgi:hypothetical protein
MDAMRTCAEMLSFTAVVARLDRAIQDAAPYRF